MTFVVHPPDGPRQDVVEAHNAPFKEAMAEARQLGRLRKITRDEMHQRVDENRARTRFRGGVSGPVIIVHPFGGTYTIVEQAAGQETGVAFEMKASFRVANGFREWAHENGIKIPAKRRGDRPMVYELTDLPADQAFLMRLRWL